MAERINNGLAKRPTIVKRCWLAKKPYLDLCNWIRNGGILSRNYGIERVITGLFWDRRRRRSPQADFAEQDPICRSLGARRQQCPSTQRSHRATGVRNAMAYPGTPPIRTAKRTRPNQPRGTGLIRDPTGQQPRAWQAPNLAAALCRWATRFDYP